MCEYTLVVDNEPVRRQKLIRVLKQINDEQDELPKIQVCDTAEQAIAFTGTHDCPIVFSGVNLPGMHGFAMIKRIKEKHDHTNFILLADQKENVIHAMQMRLRLSGTIIGVPDMDKVLDQLNNLWFPL